jgi:hypothetical protein
LEIGADIRKEDKMKCIYKFEDKSGNILYVGKTASIQGRMSQHRNGRDDDMWGKMYSIYYHEFENDTDADIYEIYLINQFDPPYNKDKNSIKSSLQLQNIDDWELYMTKGDDIPQSYIDKLVLDYLRRDKYGRPALMNGLNLKNTTKDKEYSDFVRKVYKTLEKDLKKYINNEIKCTCNKEEVLEAVTQGKSVVVRMFCEDLLYEIKSA